MAAEIKRDPIVILRIDGQDLLQYISSPSFEREIVSVYSEIESQSPNGTLHDHIIKALQQLGVDQGLPPTTDLWVMTNIVEPALKSCIGNKTDTQAVSQKNFLVEFRKLAENIAERLKEQPVIVAHTENTYNGSTIKNLLANKFETDKVMNRGLETIPRDKHGRISKDHVRVVLDSMALSTGLPLLGVVDEIDKIINDVLKMVDANDGKPIKEEEFKKLLVEILGSIMLQLEGNPVSFPTNSVVHEPLGEPPSPSHTSTS